MKFFLRFSISLMVFFVFSQISQAEIIDDDELYSGIGAALKTEGGVISVRKNSDGQRELLFNGSATGIVDDFVVILRKYKIKENDVFLIGTQCSGTSCPYILNIINLSPNGHFSKAKFDNPDQFISLLPNYVDVSVNGSELIVSGMAMPDYGEKPYKAMWTYSNGMISAAKTEASQPIQPKPKSNEPDSYKIIYGDSGALAIATVANAQGCLVELKEPEIIDNQKVGRLRVVEAQFKNGCPIQTLGVLYGVATANILPIIPGGSDAFQIIYRKGGRAELFDKLKSEDFATEPKRIAVENARK